MSQLSCAAMTLIYNSLLFFLCIATAKSSDPIAHICNDDSKTKGNSQVSRNIDLLLRILVSGTNQDGFIATSVGEGESQIFGLAQCRGDVSKNDCSVCIQDAANNTRELCPNQAEARVWYDYCLLRYKRVNFFGEVDTSGIYFYNVEDVTGVDDFNEKLGALMDQIRADAVRAADEGLGKGKSKISPFLTLYGLVQCTRDLSDINCAQCLAIGIGNFPRFCDNKKGCRVVYSSCYIRYELYPFFFPPEEESSVVHSSVKYKSFMAYEP